MPKIFQKLFNKSGQHTVEYAVILILVMAGIIIGGRYVIRSWNANMQSWEDSAIDSMLDPMMQGPDMNPLPECFCAFAPVACGPVGGCPQDQFFHQCTCTPLGCGISNPFASCSFNARSYPELTGYCECDNSCCTVPVPTGTCGGGGCDITLMEATFVCGCGPVQTTCIGHPDCVPTCTGGIVQPLNSHPCAGYGINLPGDTPNELVDLCGPLDGHCQFECDNPFFPQAGYTQCGSCAAGFVLKGPCAVGACETPLMCASGQCLSG